MSLVHVATFTSSSFNQNREIGQDRTGEERTGQDFQEHNILSMYSIRFFYSTSCSMIFQSIAFTSERTYLTIKNIEALK